MLEIIIAIVVICIIVDIFAWLADLVGGSVKLIAIIAVFVVAFLAFSWVGVFVVLLGIFIIKKLGVMLDEREKQTNDAALIKELKSSCMQLGYMNEEKWREKLPMLKNRNYSTSFQEITSNFAKEVEFQYIRQNNDWFEEYKRYVLEHPAGSTVTKMLAEVKCPALKMTHISKDGDLINTMLQRGAVRENKDVPPLFNATFIEDANEYLYTPTIYLQRLYSNEAGTTEKHKEEFDFDDL